MKLPLGVAFLLLGLAASACAEMGDSYLKKGNDYYQAGQLDKAIEQYRLALRINPQHVAVMHNLGLAYQSARDFGKAQETFHNVKKCDPQFVPAYISLGLLFAQKGRYADAQAQYAQAIALEPGNLVAHLNLAAVLAKQKQYTAALREAYKGMRISHSSPHLHLLIAGIRFDMGHYGLARLEYLKALKEEPEIPSARLRLALCMARLGRFNDALTQVQVVRDLDPNYPDLPRTAGEIHALRFKTDGQGWKEAVEQLRLAASRAPDDAQLCKELGDILAANSQQTEARKWYARARDIERKHETVSSKL